MKYLMLVCVDPDLEPGRGEGAPDVEEWVEQNDAKGIRLIGAPVRPGSEATFLPVFVFQIPTGACLTCF